MSASIFVRRGLIFALLLGACNPPASPAASSAPVASATAQTRSATLSELVNDVMARPDATGDAAPAVEGEVIGMGGLARTGADSQARLDLSEGTIVRLAPDSEFTLAELSPDVRNPVTRLALAAGQLWVILTGGELEVKTPVGSATVRGSYLGVNFDPVLKTLTATCLEGACALQNDLGTTPLTNGLAASTAGENQPPSAPRPMTDDEIQQWTQASPEAQQLLLTPTPVGTPGVPPPTGDLSGPFGPPPPGASPIPLPTGVVANTQPLRYTLSNACVSSGTGSPPTLHWHVKFEGPVIGTVDIPPGETRSGELPPGRYTATAWNDEGRGGGTKTADSDAGPITGKFCDKPPAGGPGPGEGSPPPPGTPGAPPSGEHVNTQPLHYMLTNKCVFTQPDGTVKKVGWHWKFEGPTTTIVDIPAGESRSGDLPPGRYTVSDWDDEGNAHGPNTIDSDFGSVTVTGCPDH